MCKLELRSDGIRTSPGYAPESIVLGIKTYLIKFIYTGTDGYALHI